MNYFRLLKRFPRDDRAQAMTEFVIVLPLVLFIFFSAIESMKIARAAQLGNYAAFAAARSYATSFSKFAKDDASTAHDEAEKRAKNTVLMIMAPVSHAQAGEALGLWNLVRGIALGAGGTIWDMYGIAEGFAIAALYRVKDFEVTQPANSSTGVVKVSFVYAVPMSIPGFAEMWDFFTDKGHGESAMDAFILGSPYFLDDVVDTVEEILDGLATLQGIPGVGGVFGTIKTQMESAIQSAYSASGVLGVLHTFQINCKSVCGFEPWNGTPRDDDTDDECEGDENEDTQACIDATQTTQDLAQIQATECTEAENAQQAFVVASNNYDNALAAYNTCVNNSNNPVVDCATQKQTRDDRLVDKNNAYDFAEDQQGECEDAGDDLDAAQQDVDSACDFGN